MRRVRFALLVIGTTTVLASPAAADDAASAPPAADVRLIRGKPLDEWVRALHNEDPVIQAAAADALGDAGPGTVDALPALHAALLDGNPRASDAVVHALVRVDPGAQMSLPIFLAELHNTDEKVRARGVCHLFRIGDIQSQAVLAAMAEALHDKSDEVRKCASWLIAGFGASALPAAPALIDALHDECPEVRAAAAKALGVLGPAAAPAAVPLSHAMRDQEPSVRWAAFHALREMDPGNRSAGLRGRSWRSSPFVC